jgi:hypothetical protein
MIQRPSPPIRPVLPGNAEHGDERRVPGATFFFAGWPAGPVNGAWQPTPEHPGAPFVCSLHRQEAAKPPHSPATQTAGSYNPHRSLPAAG